MTFVVFENRWQIYNKSRQFLLLQIESVVITNVDLIITNGASYYESEQIYCQ